MKKRQGFFPEGAFKSNSEAAIAVRERQEALRKLRQEERNELKQRMVTRKGLLFEETKSVWEWRQQNK